MAATNLGSWRDQALCTEVSQDPKMSDAWINETSLQRRAAMDICGTCPVAVECLDSAFSEGDTEGIRAGFHFSRGGVLKEDARKLRKLGHSPKTRSAPYVRVNSDVERVQAP